MTLGEAMGWLGKIGGSHKYALVRFCRAEASTKGPYLRFANGVLYGIPFRLDVDTVEPQSILVNDTVDATITGLPDDLPRIFP